MVFLPVVGNILDTIRAELIPLERREHLKRRKEIYEAKHPETKQHVLGGKARQGTASEIISFAADTAAKLGVSPRTVQQDGKTQQEIAEVFGITRTAVSKILGISNMKSDNANAPSETRTDKRRKLTGQEMENIAILTLVELAGTRPNTRPDLVEMLPQGAEGEGRTRDRVAEKPGMKCRVRVMIPAPMFRPRKWPVNAQVFFMVPTRKFYHQDG